MRIWKGIEMIFIPSLTTRWHWIFQASRIHALDKDFHPECFKCEVGIKTYPQHITTTLVETIETPRTAGWCWTRGWRGRSAGRSGGTCSASSATGGGRTRVSPRRVMRSEQQWSESQLEQKWCSLGRRRTGVRCLEVIAICQQISNLSYFKKTTDIDLQNIPRSQLFAPIPFDNNFDLCWISPSHWGPHCLVPN